MIAFFIFWLLFKFVECTLKTRHFFHSLGTKIVADSKNIHLLSQFLHTTCVAHPYLYSLLFLTLQSFHTYKSLSNAQTYWCHQKPLSQTLRCLPYNQGRETSTSNFTDKRGNFFHEIMKNIYVFTNLQTLNYKLIMNC